MENVQRNRNLLWGGIRISCLVALLAVPLSLAAHDENCPDVRTYELDSSGWSENVHTSGREPSSTEQCAINKAKEMLEGANCIPPVPPPPGSGGTPKPPGEVLDDMEQNGGSICIETAQNDPNIAATTVHGPPPNNPFIQQIPNGLAVQRNWGVNIDPDMVPEGQEPGSEGTVTVECTDEEGNTTEVAFDVGELGTLAGILAHEAFHVGTGTTDEGAAYSYEGKVLCCLIQSSAEDLGLPPDTDLTDAKKEWCERLKRINKLLEKLGLPKVECEECEEDEEEEEEREERQEQFVVQGTGGSGIEPVIIPNVMFDETLGPMNRGIILLDLTSNQLEISSLAQDVDVQHTVTFDALPSPVEALAYDQWDESTIVVSAKDPTTDEGVVLLVMYDQSNPAVLSVFEVYRGSELRSPSALDMIPDSASVAILDRELNAIKRLDIDTGSLMVLADSDFDPVLITAESLKVAAYRDGEFGTRGLLFEVTSRPRLHPVSFPEDPEWYPDYGVLFDRDGDGDIDE